MPELRMTDTMPSLLAQRANASPSAIAWVEKDLHGSWRKFNWTEFYRSVEQLALHLRQAGLGHGDHAAILMPNTVRWEIIQHALWRIGSVVIGLDLNDSPRRHDHILATCRPKALFVDSPERLTQFSPHLLEGLVQMVCDGSGENILAHGGLRQLDSRGRSGPLEGQDGPRGASPATIIFTSGTTGRPKALAYTHRQILTAVGSITRQFAGVPDQAHTVCWLPLANPFQRMINLCALASNWKAFIVPDPGQIMLVVKEIEPDIFAAVPRFYEKLLRAIEADIAQKPPLQRRLAAWAMDVGRSVLIHSKKQEERPFHWRWRLWVAEKLVLAKVRSLMGRRLRYLVSGSAPLPKETMASYQGLGWTLLEAYGISENILPMCMNIPGARRAGSVGRPLPENDIQIARDGEILVRSACLAANLAQEASEGFYATGDLGRIDEDGYLWLMGRKNDTFKLSTGRKIVPLPIEEALCRIEGVEYALALGNNRKYVIALLNVSREYWSRLVARNGGVCHARRLLKSHVQSACSHLPAYCQPVDVIIVDDAFSPQTGELTTNLKVRRHTVFSKYAAAIDDCYQEGAAN